MSAPLDLESLQAFVQSVDLGAPVVRSTSAPAVKSTLELDSPSYVVRGTLVSFAANTQDQQKKDTLFAILFAQLAADAQASRFTNFDSWYSTYSVTFGRIGWSVGKATTGTGRVEGVVKDYALEQLRQNITGDELETIQQSLQGVYDAGITGEATSILGRASAEPRTGVTELAVAKADQSKDITLFTQTIFFSSPKTYVTSAFFVDIPEAVATSQRTRQDTLSQLAADHIRGTLTSRVDPFVADNIRPVVPAN